MLSISYLVYSVNYHDLWFTITTLVLELQSQSQVNIDLAPLLQALHIYVYIPSAMKVSPQRGGWTYFESCDISPENTPILHAASLALFMCTCSNSAMLFCHVLEMQMCLPSFVSPSSCMVLLLWCFLLNMTAMCYNINR